MKFTKFVKIWPLFMGILCVAGITIRGCAPDELGIKEYLSGIKPDKINSLVTTFLIFGSIGSLAIAVLRMALRSALRVSDKSTEGGKGDQWEQLANPLSPALVGLCETVLYPSALLMGRGEFIAVWLALKVAAVWKRWTGEYPTEKQSEGQMNQARRRFNKFLILNALSLMLGALIYGATKQYLAT